MSHGSKHRDFDGWANHDRNVLDKFLFLGNRYEKANFTTLDR